MQFRTCLHTQQIDKMLILVVTIHPLKVINGIHYILWPKSASVGLKHRINQRETCKVWKHLFSLTEIMSNRNAATLSVENSREKHKGRQECFTRSATAVTDRRS